MLLKGDVTIPVSRKKVWEFPTGRRQVGQHVPGGST